MTIESAAGEGCKAQMFANRAKARVFAGLNSPASTAKIVGLGLVLLALPGCQSVTGSTTLSQVRVINASPDAGGGAIDVYQGSAPLAYNIGFGSNTSYVPLVPGGYSIIVDTPHTRQPLATASGTFLANQQYTVLVGNYAATLEELILEDQSQPAPSGDVSIRFIDQSVRAGVLDIYLVPTGSTLATTRPVQSGLAFNTNTGYMNLPTGTYTLVAVPAGTVPTATTVPLYSGPAVSYAGGGAETLVLIDTTVTTVPGIRVVSLTDFQPVS